MVIIITIYQTYVCKRKSLLVLGDEALKERKVASYRLGANRDQWSLWQTPHQLAQILALEQINHLISIKEIFWNSQVWPKYSFVLKLHHLCCPF